MSRVVVDVGFDTALKDKLRNINTNSTLLAIHAELARMCDPYVPFREGPLSQTHIISPEGVRYIVPYARYQYFGDKFNHTKEFHPLASARWDKAMLRDHGEEFRDTVHKVINWRLQHFDRG